MLDFVKCFFSILLVIGLCKLSISSRVTFGSLVVFPFHWSYWIHSIPLESLKKKKIYLIIYLFGRECARERVHTHERKGEREREYPGGPVLSLKSDLGLDPMTPRSPPEPRSIAGRLNWLPPRCLCGYWLFLWGLQFQLMTSLRPKVPVLPPWAQAPTINLYSSLTPPLAAQS